MELEDLMIAARKSTKSTQVSLPVLHRGKQAQRREDFPRSHSISPDLQGLKDAKQRGRNKDKLYETPTTHQVLYNRTSADLLCIIGFIADFSLGSEAREVR